MDVFQRFVEHYRVEVRFCNPASGWEKGNVENAVGFLRRNLMVPMPNAESYRKFTSWMLSRCDEIAGNTHYRKDVPISDLFAGEKTRMLPLPRVPYDACRWVTRRADREGNVEIDSNRYLAGPSWRGWTLEVGLRAFQVEIRTQDGRFVAKLPRAYGRAAQTVRNPASLLPALARKSRAWGESPIRGKGRRAHRGAGPLDRRGKPDGHGQTHQRRRNPGRRPGTGPARVRQVHAPRNPGEGGMSMGKRNTTMPDATRRRASTNRKVCLCSMFFQQVRQRFLAV